VLLSIWDDGYGISVPNEYQVAKQDIFELLSGFRWESDSGQGFNLYQVQGWDYPALVSTYLEAASRVRRRHIPAIMHVTSDPAPGTFHIRQPRAL
jgi:TPP-dependent pyruvate/acetoin dehydrogenase alpha subunit